MDNQAIFELTDRLRQLPSAFEDPPPTAGRVFELPLGRIPWEQFELLALNYLSVACGWKEPWLYGSRGHRQRGIDLLDFAQKPPPCAQVKRRKRFGPADLRAAVELWIDDPPLRSTQLTIVLSSRASPGVLDELARLRGEHPARKLSLVDAQRLNSDLRGLPDLVRAHFHESWVGSFCDPDAVRSDARHDRRSQYLSDAGIASAHRQWTRLLAAGVAPELVDEVAGLSQRIIDAKLDRMPTDYVLLLEGPYGAGKSAILDRFVQRQIGRCQSEDGLPVPVFVSAREAPPSLLSLLPDIAVGSSPPILCIDGLDEVGLARSTDLVAQSTSLRLAGRISKALLSRRPSEPLKGTAKWDIPSLSEEEAESVTSLMAGQQLRLWSFPKPAQDAIRRPLFALIAGAMKAEGRSVPESEAQFLNALVRSALAGTSGSSMRSLAALAVLTIEGGGKVPVNQLGDDASRRELLNSRLVVEDRGSARFSLPIIEQYFAAQALKADQEVMSSALADEAHYERWLYALCMALALMTWEETKQALGQVLSTLPGALWRLVDTTFLGGHDIATPVPLPTATECVSRIHGSLEGVTRILGEVCSLLPFVDASGSVLPVGVLIDRDWLTLGIWRGDPGEPDYSTLPRLFGERRSHWVLQSSKSARYSVEVWPMAEAIDLVGRSLEGLLESVGFPVNGSGLAWQERRYQIARTFADEVRATRDPVKVESFSANLFALVDGLGNGQRHGAVRFQFLGENGVPRDLVAWVEELQLMATEIRDDGLTEIERPWPRPDNLDEKPGWSWDLWSETVWRDTVPLVYRAALEIYDMLATRWLSPLKPYLGLASMWPVGLELNLKFAERTGFMPGSPGLTGRFLPLAPGSSPDVAMTDEELPWPVDQSIPEVERAILNNHHRGWRTWSRGPNLFSTVEVRMTEDAPALELAYKWLIDDLAHLGVVGSNLIRRSGR